MNKFKLIDYNEEKENELIGSYNTFKKAKSELNKRCCCPKDSLCNQHDFWIIKDDYYSIRCDKCNKKVRNVEYVDGFYGPVPYCLKCYKYR